MDDIKEIKVGEDRLFLKKSNIFGWGIVHPIKVDGKVNWKNLLLGGSWMNVIKIGLLIGLILVFTMKYSNAVTIANECLNRTTMIIFP